MIAKKKQKRWVSVILSIMMVFAFMPLLGTQEAHAIPIKDTITIDMSQGGWITTDHDEGQAIWQFLLDVTNDRVIRTGGGASENQEKMYIDFDSDGKDDATMTALKDPYKVTIEETPEHRLHELTLQRSPEALSYYKDMREIGYSFDGLAYYYREIRFVMSEMVQIRDNLNIDLGECSL